MESVVVADLSKKSSDHIKIWIFAVVVFCLLSCTLVVGGCVWLSFASLGVLAERPAVTTVPMAEWPVIFADDFSKVSDGWFVGTYSKKGYTDTRSISGGKYNWELKSAQGNAFWQAANAGVLGDFVLSVDVQHTVGSAYDDYGLMFRSTGENYYLFSIEDRGVYTLDLHSAGRWNEIIPPIRSSIIRSGDVNHLKVQAQGTHFQLFINDEYINDFDDGTLLNGDVGLLLSPNVAPGVQDPQEPHGIAYFRLPTISRAVFDNFEVRAPQSPP